MYNGCRIHTLFLFVFCKQTVIRPDFVGDTYVLLTVTPDGRLPCSVPSIIKLPLWGTPLAVPTINLLEPAGMQMG